MTCYNKGLMGIVACVRPFSYCVFLGYSPRFQYHNSMKYAPAGGEAVRGCGGHISMLANSRISAAIVSGVFAHRFNHIINTSNYLIDTVHGQPVSGAQRSLRACNCYFSPVATACSLCGFPSRLGFQTSRHNAGNACGLTGYLYPPQRVKTL